MNRWFSLGVILTLGLLLGLLGFSTFDKTPSRLKPVAWSDTAQWIAPQEPCYRFYTRRTFDIADTARGGWLQLSADNDFILYVNGQRAADELSLLNNSLGLANALSDAAQRINDALSYRTRSGSEVLMANNRDWKQSVYVDLTRFLRPGKNVIALEIQKNQQTSRMVAQGAVYPVETSLHPIDLSTTSTSGPSSWHVSTLAETRQQQQWFAPDFPDQNWSEARIIGPVRETIYSRLSPYLFDRLLQGSWISGAESTKGELWLTQEWQVPQICQRAFIRFAGDGRYALLINGLLVKRLADTTSKQLYMYDVTNLLRSGANRLMVRLNRPLDLENPLSRGSPLRFFLDGWVETADRIEAPIATQEDWQAWTQSPAFGDQSTNAENVANSQPTIVLGAPNPQEFHRKFAGDAYLTNYPNSLLRQSMWQVAAIGLALLAAWSIGRVWLEQHNRWRAIEIGAGLLLPGTLFLIGMGVLKHRYAEAERGLLFAQPQANLLIFSGFFSIVCLSLWWSRRQHVLSQEHCSSPQLIPFWSFCSLLGLLGGLCIGWMEQSVGLLYLISLVFLSVGLLFLFWNKIQSSVEGNALKNWLETSTKLRSSWHWLVLGLIVSIGFALRIYHLDFIDLVADESVSLDATRHILHTGIPESTSGIWYTRSPAYHYMLALWLGLTGDSIINARGLSVLWGTATLVLLFLFTRQLTGKTWIALIVTALFAIDPWTIMFSRLIRFYQVVQFMSLLTFWLFLRGFIDKAGKAYQYSFFVALALTVLSQELTLTLFPCFLIGFICFYRPFNLRKEPFIVLLSLITIAIGLFDLAFFTFKCLTPSVAISTTTGSILQPHLLNVSYLVNSFLVGFNRNLIIYSIFFFLGFIYFLKRQDGKLLFLFGCVLFNLVILTILLMQVANRYLYHIYPFFIVLSIYSAVQIVIALGRNFERGIGSLLPFRSITLGFLTLLLLSNVEPARLLAGYQQTPFPRVTQAYDYIRQHKQSGDVVISNAPFQAAIFLGGIDYFLPGVVPFDAVYLSEGQVIDRWAGGKLLSNADQLAAVLATAERAWIHLDDHKTEGLELAGISAYASTLGTPVLDTFGTRLQLWQPADGIFPRVPNQGKDLGNY